MFVCVRAHGEVSLSPFENLHFEGESHVMGLDESAVSGERPRLPHSPEAGYSNTHTRYFLHAFSHICMSLCQNDFPPRRRKHAGNGKWGSGGLECWSQGEAGGAHRSLFQL